MTETATCSIERCGRPEHLRGLCRDHYVRQRRALEETRWHPRAWSPEEDRRLIYILDSTPDGLGRALPGELDEIAVMLAPARTMHATRKRLTNLRRRRKKIQTAAVIALKQP